MFVDHRHRQGCKEEIDYLRDNLIEGQNITFKTYFHNNGEPYTKTDGLRKKIRVKILKKYEHYILCRVYGEFGGAPWLECFQYFDLLKGEWKYGL